MSEELVYHEDEWPHGLQCAAMGCGHIFSDGEPYSERLDAVTDEGIPIVVITCVPCGLSSMELLP